MKTQPILSNLQLELLKLYANNISELQLFEIKLMLAHYFAQKASDAMDDIWEFQGLTEQTMIEWTNEHHRKYWSTNKQVFYSKGQSRAKAQNHLFRISR